MKNSRVKRSLFALLLVINLVSGLVLSPVSLMRAEAKTKLSVTVKVGSKKANKKTITMKKSSSKKIKLSIAPNESGIKTKYKSGKKSIVSVSKTGKLKAKKTGTAKIIITLSGNRIRKTKVWFKVKVTGKSDSNKNTVTPSETPTVIPTETPTETPSETPSTEPAESIAPDTVLDMYEITIKVNGKTFLAKLYQTETTKSIMQKLPLSITMNELNGNEKYYYFSESFPMEPEGVSEIHAGDLKLYGSSCLVLFYESFTTSYSYTSLGYVENPEGLAEALGTGSVHVEIFGSE